MNCRKPHGNSQNFKSLIDPQTDISKEYVPLYPLQNSAHSNVVKLSQISGNRLMYSVDPQMSSMNHLHENFSKENT